MTGHYWWAGRRMRFTSATWWDGRLMPDLGCGLVGTMAGVHIERHSGRCQPGMWAVAPSVSGFYVSGWDMLAHAVVDDFGTLVQVR